MKSKLLIFLILCIFLIGCSAPEQSSDRTTTPTQTPPPPTPNSEELGIEEIEEELNEMEKILSELESLENISFEI